VLGFNDMGGGGLLKWREGSRHSGAWRFTFVFSFHIMEYLWMLFFVCYV
jgi:hypothetical protein